MVNILIRVTDSVTFILTLISVALLQNNCFLTDKGNCMVRREYIHTCPLISYKGMIHKNSQIQHKVNMILTYPIQHMQCENQ